MSVKCKIFICFAFNSADFAVLGFFFRIDTQLEKKIINSSYTNKSKKKKRLGLQM